MRATKLTGSIGGTTKQFNTISGNNAVELSFVISANERYLLQFNTTRFVLIHTTDNGQTWTTVKSIS